MFDKVLNDIFNGYSLNELLRKYPNLYDIMLEKNLKLIQGTNCFVNDKGFILQLYNYKQSESNYGFFAFKNRDEKFKYAYALLLLGYNRELVADYLSRYENVKNRLYYLDNLMYSYGFSLEDNRYFDNTQKKFIDELNEKQIVDIILDKHQDMCTKLTETVNILNNKIDNISTTFSDLKIKNSKLELKDRYIINKLYEISKNQDLNNSEMKDDIIKLLKKLPEINSIINGDKPLNEDGSDMIETSAKIPNASILKQTFIYDEVEDDEDDII